MSRFRGAAAERRAGTAMDSGTHARCAEQRRVTSATVRTGERGSDGIAVLVCAQASGLANQGLQIMVCTAEREAACRKVGNTN